MYVFVKIIDLFYVVTGSRVESAFMLAIALTRRILEEPAFLTRKFTFLVGTSVHRVRGELSKSLGFHRLQDHHIIRPTSPIRRKGG